MRNSILAIGLSVGTALAGMTAPALADGEEEAASSGFSGTLTLTSDYRFRGVSQSDNGAALQGSVDYNHESGFYVGAWASNIQFDDDPIDARIELDLYAGYSIALSDVTEVSLKGVYYWYVDADIPSGDPAYDYFEVIGGISRKLGKTDLSLEVAYSPDYFLEVGAAWAVTGGIGFPLCETLWFFDGGLDGSAHFGVQAFDDATVPDYTFWDLGVTATWGNFDLDARYVDTDLDVVECGLDICEGGVVVSGTLNFGG